MSPDQSRGREPQNAVEWMLVVKDERDRAEAAEAALKTLRERLDVEELQPLIAEYVRGLEPVANTYGLARYLSRWLLS